MVLIFHVTLTSEIRVRIISILELRLFINLAIEAMKSRYRKFTDSEKVVLHKALFF